MPPEAALLLVGLFVVAALIVDSRHERRVSASLWVPTIWVAILASRPVAQWLDPEVGTALATSESNPIDRAILLVLMATAGVILTRRRFSWTEWAAANPWVVLLILYFGVSVLWSDVPAVAFKRWVRALGALAMILVVLTELNRTAAIGTIIRRCGYILVPLSVLCIKYYRAYGVEYNNWTGEQMLVGVTTGKNGLGRLCMVVGLFILWDRLMKTGVPQLNYGRAHRLLDLIILTASFWLLVKSNSATSLLVFIAVACTLIALRTRVVSVVSRHLGTITISVAVAALVANEAFGLTDAIIQGVGRDRTLTERTLLWPVLLDMAVQPIVGAGYDSFWTGRRLAALESEFHVNSAHNGYLEIYLDLGVMGLVLFTAFLLSTFRKTKALLQTNVEYGALRLALLATFLLYNVTESAYRPTAFVGFLLFLLAMDYGMRRKVTQAAIEARGASPVVRSSSSALDDRRPKRLHTWHR